MTHTSRRRALGLLLVAIAVPLTTAGCPSRSDCDAEDRRTGDDDCDDSHRSKPRRPSRPKSGRR